MVPIVDISTPSRFSIEEKFSYASAEPNPKEVASKLQGYFTQILLERRQPSLGGSLGFENSNDLLEYSYNTSTFCNFDTKKASHGKITLEYHSFQQWKGQNSFSAITLTDVAPFGSVDKVQVLVDKDVKVPFYANYAPGKKVQKFYGSLLRGLEHELEQYAQRHSTFNDFDFADKVIHYKSREITREHEKLLISLLRQEPLPGKDIQLYNACDKP